MKWLNSSIWPINRLKQVVYFRAESLPGNNGYEEVLQFPQSFTPGVLLDVVESQTQDTRNEGESSFAE